MISKQEVYFNSEAAYLNNYRYKAIKLPLVIIMILLIITSGTDAFSEEQPEGQSADNNTQNELYSEQDDLYGDEYVKTAEQSVADPLYWFNYAMFSFNDKLYFWLLKPVAQGYKFITPAELRSGLKNFFHNALFPVRFVNTILQGKGERALAETESFIINTVGGGLGFATPAQYVFGIETYNEDLGQTLGRYSVKEGFYLVLPVMGSSTLRDSIGSVGDFFLSPTTYIESAELAAGVTALDRINSVSFRIGDYETLKSAALDPYVALRDAYIQMRRKQVNE
ncbi:MAG: VacJ family lipoprotein [Desulfamplus sp.]|nr:VacJ family lipoprotein [Desulfamplus sp.]MBF0411121.1 VacJ family lipoprotein [Desulfamplus sp.]